MILFKNELIKIRNILFFNALQMYFHIKEHFQRISNLSLALRKNIL